MAQIIPEQSGYQLEHSISALAQAQAKSFGLRADVVWRSVYVVVVNDEVQTAFARQVALELLGSERVTEQGPPLTGSEDCLHAGAGAGQLCADRQRRRPRPAPGRRGGGMVHHPGYDFNDDNIAVGSAYWVRLAQRLLGV